MLFWILTTIAAGITVLAIIKKPRSVYDNASGEKNPFEGKRVRFVENPHDPMNADGVCGHLEAVGESKHQAGLYERFVKRFLDVIFSFFGLVILSPLYLILILAVVIDDPGPVFFVQKRVGKNKRFFALHKFRSMKMSTPHDVPTHMLSDPESYITRVGRVLRKLSFDRML